MLEERLRSSVQAGAGEMRRLSDQLASASAELGSLKAEMAKRLRQLRVRQTVERVLGALLVAGLASAVWWLRRRLLALEARLEAPRWLEHTESGGEKKVVRIEVPGVHREGLQVDPVPGGARVRIRRDAAPACPPLDWEHTFSFFGDTGPFELREGEMLFEYGCVTLAFRAAQAERPPSALAAALPSHPLRREPEYYDIAGEEVSEDGVARQDDLRSRVPPPPPPLAAGPLLQRAEAASRAEELQRALQRAEAELPAPAGTTTSPASSFIGTWEVLSQGSVGGPAT